MTKAPPPNLTRSQKLVSSLIVIGVFVAILGAIIGGVVLVGDKVARSGRTTNCVELGATGDELEKCKASKAGYEAFVAKRAAERKNREE